MAGNNKGTDKDENENENENYIELQDMQNQEQAQKNISNANTNEQITTGNKTKNEEDAIVNAARIQSQPDENAQGNNTLEETDLPVNEQNPPPGKQMTAINKAIAMIDKYPKDHDETNKPKISNTTGIVLGALGFGLGLPLVMLAFMGMPALAIVALPILLGGIAAVAIGVPLFNSYKIGTKVREYLNKIPLVNLPSLPWVDDQKELATVAKLNDTATELRNQGITNKIPESKKKEIEEKAKRLESIHASLDDKLMSSDELKKLLHEASTLVTECETLNKDNKQSKSQMTVITQPPEEQKNKTHQNMTEAVRVTHQPARTQHHSPRKE